MGDEHRRVSRSERTSWVGVASGTECGMQTPSGGPNRATEDAAAPAEAEQDHRLFERRAAGDAHRG